VLLIDALRYKQNFVLAFVGAGGKTTALFKAARELLTDQEREIPTNSVFLTTTTHLGTWQAGLSDQLCLIDSSSELTRFKKNIPTGVTLLVGGESNQRFSGLSANLLDSIYRIALDNHFPLLIEADGSGKCPLKAPTKHEPVIPKFTQYVVVVAGLNGLAKPLTRDWVHRSEIFAKISGLNIGDPITIESLVNVLRSNEGGLKNIPSTARKILLLNQAETTVLQSQGRAISNQLINEYHSIIIASLLKDGSEDFPYEVNKHGDIHAVVEKIAGIILAAGESSRFGKPKQLMLWKGQPYIRHVIFTAMKAGLDPIVVVVGYSGEEVKKVISDLPVRIVNNQEWKMGLSSSIQVGVTALPKTVGGVIFLQADQPQISKRLIESIIEAHQSSLSPIVAPKINGQRGNPVLFDTKIFPNLLSLTGDVGGRMLFSNFPVCWVKWPDPKQLIDIDTVDDYQKFLEIYNGREEADWFQE
jgi:molybdenum cofactor cytidylyltransferase